MPIHVIHVVHNTYDNIATVLLYNEHQKFSVNETHKCEDEEGLDSQINGYFYQVRSVVEMIQWCIGKILSRWGGGAKL